MSGSTSSHRKPAPVPVQAELEQSAKVGAALREVAFALGSPLELDELLALILKKLKELTQAREVWLFELDEKEKLFRRREFEGEQTELAVPQGEGLLSQTARIGRSRRLEAHDPDILAGEWLSFAGSGQDHVLLTPLKNNLGRSVGVLLVLRESRHGLRGFDAGDEELASVLARQAQVAWDNARLFVSLLKKNQLLQKAQEQLTRRLRDLELLFELERATSRAQSHEDLAEVVLRSLAYACDAESAHLVLRGEEGAPLALYSLSRAREANGAQAEAKLESRVLENSQVGAWAETLEQAAGGGGPVLVEVLDSDGESLGALALRHKLRGDFGSDDVALLRLVTANLTTAVRLFDSNRAREREERLSSIGRLLSQVVHDLKSPLAVISGYVELMEAASERTDRAACAAEILKQFEALGAMQREVLAFARGETQVLVRKLLLDRFVEELRPILERELGARPVKLEFEVERKLSVRFDSERVTRALQNLVRNAAEAMSEKGGSITLSLKSAGDDLLIAVRDDGPGVPKSIASRLFQSFVTAGKPGGTGLGLAIVKRIVEEHGGSVVLEPSEQGACFLLSLPSAVVRRKRGA